MKKYLLYIITIFLISSCNKSDFLDKVNFQKFLLAGSGNYENTSHTWFLDSLVINGVPKVLSLKEKQYNRTYDHNGTFFDSDGYSGKWDIKNNNELITLFKNNITSTFVESKWLIKDITSTKLIYQITNTDNSKYDFYFKISYE